MGWHRAGREYLSNTAVVRTELSAPSCSVEVTDFAPRFKWRDRSFRRRCSYGASCRPRAARGFSHQAQAASRIRKAAVQLDPRLEPYQVSSRMRRPLRLTTDAPLDYVESGAWFILTAPIAFLFGVDEAPSESVADTADDFLHRTVSYWREWVQRLGLPFEWQDA